MQRRTLWSIVLILCSFSVLADIKALLELSAHERIRLHSMQEMMVNARPVYYKLMALQDRDTIEQFLDFQFANNRAYPRPSKTLQWINDDTNISYSVTFGDHYSRKKDGKHLYNDCQRTDLNVSLYAGDKPDLKNTQKDFGIIFCSNEKLEWLIQLPRSK